MLYEYKRYSASPGKIKDLEVRFRTLTLPMFERHGIRQLGFWRAVFGHSNELHYILIWDSLAERQEKWSAFSRDPEWLRGLADSELNGPLTTSTENQLWEATDYSALR